MTEVHCSIACSLDGYVAGPAQTPDEPLGRGGERLHRWMVEEADQHAAELARILAPRAFVMGRNMFAGPGAGPWDARWRGWWGEEPPYHAPVFVLTHHGREPLEMAGGTTFHFVTDGLDAALDRARAVASAAGGDIGVCGGADVVNQCLRAGVVDELSLHVAPLFLGGGARLFDGVPPGDLELVDARSTGLVVHQRYRLRSTD